MQLKDSWKLIVEGVKIQNSKLKQEENADENSQTFPPTTTEKISKRRKKKSRITNAKETR